VNSEVQLSDVEPIDLAQVDAAFDDPVHDSQRCFRRALHALANPGTIVHCGAKLRPPAKLCCASTALLLTLLDSDCSLWISPGARTREVGDFFKFHTGCTSVATPAEARFALVNDELELPRLESFDWGSDEYPDRSVSLIIQVACLQSFGSWQFTGPGIERSRSVRAGNLPLWFIGDWALVHASFPRGLEVFMCSEDQVMALARTTRLTLQSESCTLR
jgi:alpha-D-ribose 1-methylphosphonate 5-triphosphate synthase subunit PhnH